MDNKILLSELAEKLAVQSEISKRAAESFLRTFFSLIEQNMLSDRFVKIKDIGTFKLVDVNDRESVNVATGERIQIESHSKISFVAEGKLRDLVNRPFAYLTNIELEEETTLEELNNVDKALGSEVEASETPEETPTAPVEDVTFSSAPVAGVIPPVTESIEPVIPTPSAPEKVLPAQEIEPASAAETNAAHVADPMHLAAEPMPQTEEPAAAIGTPSAAPHNQAQEIALALLKIIETAQGTHLTPQELVSAFQMLQTPATETPVAAPAPEKKPAEEVAEEAPTAATGRRERRRTRRDGKRISTMRQQQEENATELTAEATAVPAENKETTADAPAVETIVPVIAAEEETPRPVRLKDRQNPRRRVRGEFRHTAVAASHAEEEVTENLAEAEEIATSATENSQPIDEMPATPAVEALSSTQPATHPSTSLSKDAAASLQEIMQSPSDLMTALQEVTQSPQEVMEVLRELAQGSAQEAQPQRPTASQHPHDATEVEFTPFVRPVRHTKEESEEEESEKPEWKRFLNVGLIALAALLLIGIAFWAIFIREPKQGMTEAPPAMEQAIKTNAAEKAYVDSICENELRAMGNQEAYGDGTDLDMDDAPGNIKQLPNAAYEILGTAEVHTMQAGETLNYLALKALGTADLVNYIIFYNDPTSITNLSAGTKVKVPTLRRKSTGEIINKK